MATGSPESPSKKRKQPINGLKRDQPLFAGRRPTRTLQPPDFLTDSLNTSYIPSPSPPKSPTRRDVRAKPRQVLGNSRALAAALKATSRVNDENRPPSSSSSSDRNRASEPIKARPAPSTALSKGLPSSKPDPSPTRDRTPSPPRGRQNSITSPANSESSPGRGYAEAYQRIVEEENLAQEDSIEDMEEIGGYDFNQQDRLQDLDRLRLHRLRQSASPMSLKASRRASPRGVTQESAPIDDGTEDKENAGRDSDSESGVDYTENVTDTSMDSGSSQYAKDLQRLGALKNGAKAFSKARMGERVGLSVENLQRRNGSNESLGSSFSARSLSNRGSDPSINIPKAWGRKAKPGKDWLSRINSRSGRFTGDVQKRHSSGDQIIADNQRRDWSEPIDQWIDDAAGIPLPSSEDISSQTREFSQGSTPTTTVPRSASLDRRRQWEMNDDDFTGRSIQISESPPIRIRNSTLDRMRDREIENLEKRAVTTNRLGELREKSSGESLQRIQSNLSSEEPRDGQDHTSLEASKRGGSSRRSYRQAESQDLDQDATPEESLLDAGEPIPDTPVVIYRHNLHDPAVPERKGGKRSGDESDISLRPDYERKDSHDLLKRLARVTSESPSPTRQHAVFPQPLQQGTEVSIERTPQATKSTSNLKTPVITGAWVDQTLDETLQPSMPSTNLKTPLITGAWVDTPLPTGGRGPPMPTPSDQEEQKELNAGKLGAADLIQRLSPNNISSRPKLQTQAPLKYSGPPLAKSALEEIIKDAKTAIGGDLPKVSRDSDSEEEPTLHLGDSTIQSLEELIANDEDFSTLLAPTPPSPETSQPSSDPSLASQVLTTSTRTSRSSRLADLQSYTHLLSRLTNLAPSLRASKKQIETIERAVSTAPASTSRSLAKRNSEECNEAGELHDFLFPCQTCGCPGRMDLDRESLLKLRDSITTITLPIPRLWRWKQNDWRPRLTWLGVLTFLTYALYLAESYARFKYCHPLYARTMVGYGVDIDAPRPPFVLAKVIYRHTAIGTLLAPFYHVTRIVLKLLASFVGYLVGFMFGDEGVIGQKAEKQPASRDARIPRPNWGPDLSLMDDEYL